MQPLFNIVANNTDITSKMSDRFLSLTVTDERGMDSDTVEIRLDDRDNALALLSKGVTLNVSIGKKDNNGKVAMVNMGLYVVDDIELSGPPDTYVIKAKAADMRASLKAQKTRGWDSVSLSDIVTTIAKEHGLKPAVETEVGKTVYTHLAQTEESDLHFLTRLAKELDSIAKPVQGRLLFIPKGLAKSKSGKDIKPVSVSKNQCDDWHFVLADRDKYQSVIAYWDNKSTGEKIAERAGSGEPVFTIKGTSATQEAAKKAAAAKLNALSRGSSTGDITIKGGALDIRAETPLDLVGFRKGAAGRWLASRVVHRLAGSALSCSVNLETK